MVIILFYFLFLKVKITNISGRKQVVHNNNKKYNKVFMIINRKKLLLFLANVFFSSLSPLFLFFVFIIKQFVLFFVFFCSGKKINLDLYHHHDNSGLKSIYDDDDENGNFYFHLKKNFARYLYCYDYDLFLATIKWLHHLILYIIIISFNRNRNWSKFVLFQKQNYLVL